MEALVAVGLAGNVVQFVDFSAKLMTEVNWIRKNGSPKSLPELKRLTDSLTRQAGSLHQFLSAKSPTKAFTQEDQV